MFFQPQCHVLVRAGSHHHRRSSHAANQKRIWLSDHATRLWSLPLCQWVFAILSVHKKSYFTYTFQLQPFWDTWQILSPMWVRHEKNSKVRLPDFSLGRLLINSRQIWMQPNWTPWKRTCECEECLIISKPKWFDGSTTCGWPKSLLTKSDLLDAFQVRLFFSLCHCNLHTLMFPRVLQTNSKPRSPFTFIWTRSSGWKYSKTPRQAFFVNSFYGCDRCSLVQEITFAERVRWARKCT